MAKRTPRAGEGRGEGGGGVKEVRRGSVDYWTKGREKSEATVNMFTAGSAIFFFRYGNNCSVAFQNNLSDKHLKNICKVNLDFEMFL